MASSLCLFRRDYSTKEPGRPLFVADQSGRGGGLFVEQAVDALRLGKACNRKLAEVVPAAAADAGKTFGGHDGAAHLARQLFQPSGKIDRRSDAGEVEPRAAPDIA